jgi:hypothetical protein
MGARRIHGEGGETSQIATVEFQLRRPVGRLRGLALDSPREPAPDVAVLEQSRDHVGRPARIAQLADDFGPAAALAQLDQRDPAGRRRPAPAAQLDPAAALEQQLADQEAPALRDENRASQGC